MTFGMLAYRTRKSILGNTFTAIIFAIVLAGAAPHAQAREAGAEAFINRVSNQLIAIMQSSAPQATKRKKFAAVFAANADVRSIGLFALGKYRRKLPAGKQGEYFSLMRRYISNIFSTHMKDISGSKVEITGSQNRGKKGTFVSSKLHFPGKRPSPLTWRLSRRGGGYKVFDVRIFSIWLGPEQRTVFTGIISRNGGDTGALLKFLRKK